MVVAVKIKLILKEEMIVQNFMEKKFTIKDFIKKYNLASMEGYKNRDLYNKPNLVSGFCSFYRLGSSKR